MVPRVVIQKTNSSNAHTMCAFELFFVHLIYCSFELLKEMSQKIVEMSQKSSSNEQKNSSNEQKNSSNEQNNSSNNCKTIVQISKK